MSSVGSLFTNWVWKRMEQQLTLNIAITFLFTYIFNLQIPVHFKSSSSSWLQFIKEIYKDYLKISIKKVFFSSLSSKPETDLTL